MRNALDQHPVGFFVAMGTARRQAKGNLWGGRGVSRVRLLWGGRSLRPGRQRRPGLRNAGMAIAVVPEPGSRTKA